MMCLASRQGLLKGMAETALARCRVHVEPCTDLLFMVRPAPLPPCMRGHGQNISAM